MLARVVLLGLLAGASVLEGQSLATFTGSVTDAITLRGIANAELVLNDSGQVIFADSSGAFRVKVDPGPYRITVRKIGYQPVSETLVLGRDSATARSYRLVRAQVMDTISITEPRLRDFADNMRTGLGSFLTREQLQKQEGRRLSEVLSHLRGINVIRGSMTSAWVSSNRGARSITSCGRHQRSVEGTGLPPSAACSCFVQVYLDGTVLYDGRRGIVPDINRFYVESLEAVEFYSGPAQTPARYANLDSHCGVLVLHTRKP